MSGPVSTIIINFHEQSKRGVAQIVFRCAKGDREIVTRAAHRVGLPVSEFMRLVVIQSAHQILKSAITQYEQQTVPEYTDIDRVQVDPSLPPGVKA